MVEVIAGRDAELVSLRDFIARVSGGAVALVLEGEAGMGKTTLWRAAVEHAEELGLLVLQAQPVESETTLSFAGVGDLLDSVLDTALELLPAVQRNALSRSLALGDDEGPGVEPRTLRVALMNVLRLLADERPVLVAIDDSQWLDLASSSGLAYGVRRFRTERIGLLLSRRSGLESVLLNELVRSPAGERFTRVHVGPLDVAVLGRAVHEQLGTALPRPLLAEVHQASGGNPFYALEIVRMLQRSDISIEAGQPLPVPESLHDLVRGRLLALPAESRDFLLAASAYAHPTINVTEAASGVGRDVGLTPALQARLVELDGGRIRFTHPLLAAGAYETGDPIHRHEIHVRLAELLDDPEARAWQLAASVHVPDERVAAVLDDAARHARARGAPRPAALLLDRACELTPERRLDSRRRRAVDAAYLHYESGDSSRAEAQLRAVISELAWGRERARALVRLARVRTFRALGEAADLFLQAVEEAEGDREILAVAHEGVATCFWQLYERLEPAIQHAEMAIELALDLGDEALAGEALNSLAMAEWLLGHETAAATMERALACQPAAEQRRVLAQPRWFPESLAWTGALEEARHELEQMLARVAELGDESSAPYLLACMSRVECDQGELVLALEGARRAQAAAEQAGQLAILAYSVAHEALAEARRGDESAARPAALRAIDLASEAGDRQSELVARWALAHLELASGAPGRAASQLDPASSFARREAICEPCAIPFVVHQIEALIQLGRRDEAVELLDWYEGNARRLDRTSALANCARCRGLLAAADGRVDDAIEHYAEGLSLHQQVELLLDKGQTLLALGAAQRRSKRRREARETLEEALGVFEGMGAALWAERARAELARISGRAATPGALTPAEERVAALVAEGKTNREVAATLFLSDRTVEGHLTHVFGKLGIKHRSEVGSALASRQTQEVDSPNTGDSPVSAERSAP